MAAARELSAHLRPTIDFRLADAEALPLPGASFDGVISTFGAMFALDQTRAARELARVCRPGGRLVLTAWVPNGSVAEFVALLGRYGDAPPPPARRSPGATPSRSSGSWIAAGRRRAGPVLHCCAAAVEAAYR